MLGSHSFYNFYSRNKVIKDTNLMKEGSTLRSRFCSVIQPFNLYYKRTVYGFGDDKNILSLIETFKGKILRGGSYSVEAFNSRMLIATMKFDNKIYLQ